MIKEKYLKHYFSFITIVKTRLIIIPLIFLLLIFSVSAIKVNNAACYDDGSFEITLKANSEKYAYTKEMIVSADNKKIKGTWDNDKIRLTSSADEKYATFTGLENQLVEEKEYSMKILYKLRTEESEEDSEINFSLKCPGLVFTCHKMSIKIKECLTSKSGKFTSILDIHGLEQSEKGKMDPIKVIGYILNTQLLYKDINGFTSKRGSLPEGAIIKKIAEDQYQIEANFPKYTTNHVKQIWVKFNDELKKPCNPLNYPNAIFSDKKDCEYKETEEDILAELKEGVGEPTEPVNEQPEQEEKTDLSEAKKTGYSVKESVNAGEGSPKKKERLNIMLFSLLGVIIIGGILLSYLYKQGYFY